jgi:hypothetical protein
VRFKWGGAGILIVRHRLFFLSVRLKREKKPRQTAEILDLSHKQNWTKRSIEIPHLRTDMELTFGKFEGRTVVEMAGDSYETRSYLRFLLTKEDLYENLRDAISVALNQSTRINLSLSQAKAVVIRFGKHRGSTVGQVATSSNGRDYLFLYLLAWDKLKEELREAIQVVHEEYERTGTASP